MLGSKMYPMYDLSQCRFQRYHGFRSIELESKTFLQVQFHGIFVMAKVSYGDILANTHPEISAACRNHKASLYGRSPDDIAIDKFLEVMQHRISFITATTGCGVGIGAEYQNIGSVYAS